MTMSPPRSGEAGGGTLRTRPLFSMTLAVDGFVTVGSARRIAGITGGSFSGERLRGTVLPGGTDWQTLRADGAVLLDGRIVLRTDDGALVAMTYTGIRHGPPDVMARLGRGEPVDPASYYFRIVPTFQAAEGRYEWLNRIVAVADGQRLPEGPVYQVYEIL
jgi:hypothetical protein